MKILLGTDGSSHALAAARFLARRTKVDRVRVDLVQVLSPKRQRREERNGRLEEPTVGDLGSRIDQTDWLLTTRGVEVRRVTKSGTPARVLTELAGEGGYDLVAVGAKGTSATPFHDVGSVALSLLEHAPTPVLVVRPEATNGTDNHDNHEPRHQGPARVLVPTDGKAASHQALLHFMRLFPELPAELVVMTAVEDLPAEMLDRLSPSDLQRYRWYVEGVAEARLKDMVDRLEPLGLPVEIRRVDGPPARSIVEAAAVERADLVVIGSRAVRNPAERHLGGVGGAIARSASCSVLVVRDGAIAAAEEQRPPMRRAPARPASRGRSIRERA